MYRMESNIPLLSNYNPEESLSSGYDSASEVSDVSPCECLPSENTCEARDAGEVMIYRNPYALCEDMKYILSVSELCDVTFLVGDRQTPIHGLRAVLGTRSRVLYQLILEAQRNANKTRKMSPSKRMVSKLMSPKTPKTSKQANRKLVISMPDYEAEVFRKVIRYIHCGVVKVDATTVVGLLNAASEFGLGDLRMACWDFLDRCINVPTVLDLLKTTEKYTEKSQTEKILKLYVVCAPQRPTTHQDLGQSRLARDSADVEKIVDAIVLQYHNPFDLETVPSSLINIVTGQVASREVEESLTTLEATGRSQMIKFAEKRLLQKTISTSFWEPQSRTKIKTFADMRQSLPSVKDKKMICSSEVLFRRLLSVSNARDIDMKIVLQHELAAVPPALFNDDGTMRKINKSDLASKLESVCPEVHTLPDTLDEDQITAYIIDGMAVFQSMNESLFNTFDDLAAHVMKKVLRLLNDSKLRIGTVVLVYDRYDRYHSIKKMERTRRGTGDNTPSHIIVGSRNVPNYRLFLQGAANKSALAAFVCEYIASNAPSHLGENKSILLAGGFADGKLVKSLRRTGVVMVPPLFSSHEEADTRMVLHAIDLSATCTRIIIQCDDTDVLVILLYYYSKELLCREIFMQAGHMTKLRNRQRYIPVHTIGNNLGTRVCQCLPSAHALTGSDTTNAIYRIGKRTAFKVLVDHIDLLFMLSEFGVSSPFTTSLRHARMYVLLLYGKKSAHCSTLDDLRYVLAPTTDKTGAMLPPTEDAFKHHVLRAQFQTSIWCKSHEANPPTFDPIGHGWKKGESGALEPTMCEKECAPLQLRDITHLFCNDEGCNVANKCPCLLAGLQCIDICSCADCPNSTTQLDLSDDDSDND